MRGRAVGSRFADKGGDAGRSVTVSWDEGGEREAGGAGAPRKSRPSRGIQGSPSIAAPQSVSVGQSPARRPAQARSRTPGLRCARPCAWPTRASRISLRAGQQEVLADAIKNGDIRIVGEQCTDGWKPETAQKNLEQILTRNANQVAAVVASYVGMARGVVAVWWRRARRVA